MVQPQHPHIVPFIIVIIIIIIIIITIWKGYFSISPILRFCSLKVEKMLLSMWS